mmetsp:Transcript_64421/g.170630  ORF Transcript_64421/g.170630 Transcript_64421/m.170630 type:complete len:220 (-) Transcript_64421:812-1471(-)
MHVHPGGAHSAPDVDHILLVAGAQCFLHDETCRNLRILAQPSPSRTQQLTQTELHVPKVATLEQPSLVQSLLQVRIKNLRFKIFLLHMVRVSEERPEDLTHHLPADAPPHLELSFLLVLRAVLPSHLMVLNEDGRHNGKGGHRQENEHGEKQKHHRIPLDGLVRDFRPTVQSHQLKKGPRRSAQTGKPSGDKVIWTLPKEVRGKDGAYKQHSAHDKCEL